jgi:hypothetical protein
MASSCGAGWRRKQRINVMNVTIGLDQSEEILNCNIPDEALEIAAAARKGIAVHYTFQFCTATDCALMPERDKR